MYLSTPIRIGAQRSLRVNASDTCDAQATHSSGETEDGAGDGNRTHMASLEGWNFTTKLHPHGGAGTILSAQMLSISVGELHFDIVATTISRQALVIPHAHGEGPMLRRPALQKESNWLRID